MRIFSTRKQLVAALPRQAVVAEVGVQRGDFSRSILRKAKPRRLHLIDCWEEYRDSLEYPHDGSPDTQNDHEQHYARVMNRFASEIATGRVELHRGYSLPVLQTFPDLYFDWIYIDANHTYEAVSSELAAARPKIKPGGVIAGHDYINSTYWKKRNFGVVEAVDEFCVDHAWEIIGKTSGPGWDVDQTDNPSFAIRQSGLSPLWYAWEEWLPFVIGRAA